jgi:hypothetical protein
MDESLRAQIDLYLPRLDALIRRGGQLRDPLAADPSSKPDLIANRVWQQDVGVAVNELSGGSKAHWLARAFSEAFLLRSSGGTVVQDAEPAEIVGRLVDVLKQAVASLAQLGDAPDGALTAAASVGAPAPRRFDFVHNGELRPVLEQAYADSRRALDEGHYDEALLTACGILEAIVTDALEHQGLVALDNSSRPAGNLSDWTFETRLAVAEKSGLIRGGCARLPPVARAYRKSDANSGAGNGPSEAAVISERDARVVGQVLRVVMRDLDPGR